MAVGVHDMSRFIQLVTILCDFAWYHNFDKAYCKKGPTGCGKNNLSLTMNRIKQSICENSSFIEIVRSSINQLFS